MTTMTASGTVDLPVQVIFDHASDYRRMASTRPQPLPPRRRHPA